VITGYNAPFIKRKHKSVFIVYLTDAILL